MVRKKTYRALPLAPDPLPRGALILPWSCVCSDNDRFVVVYGQNRLSPKYRKAKTNIAALASLYWRHPLLTGDVVLVAHFYFPDERKRDAGNYRKAITDALSGVVYDDDKRIADERYLKVAIDRENPRVEVMIGPLAARDVAA